MGVKLKVSVTEIEIYYTPTEDEAKEGTSENRGRGGGVGKGKKMGAYVSEVYIPVKIYEETLLSPATCDHNRPS